MGVGAPEVAGAVPEQQADGLAGTELAAPIRNQNVQSTVVVDITHGRGEGLVAGGEGLARGKGAIAPAEQDRDGGALGAIVFAGGVGDDEIECAVAVEVGEGDGLSAPGPAE